jgi:hypothetical protein
VQEHPIEVEQGELELSAALAQCIDNLVETHSRFGRRQFAAPVDLQGATCLAQRQTKVSRPTPRMTP